ncbi:hypothetical protein TD95_000799, partial [Thielaviopsis punctulata]
LTSRQYGVATIWQAATVNTKACMSRKAISGVDIDRAVKKILDPGVPLALRLQSNLLFGVSRVYYQKCHYVLDDATRVMQKLRVAYNDIGNGHQANPNTVKAARHQIVLEDDPAFIWNSIAAPDFTWQEPLLKTTLDLSQHDTLRTSSHMSPASSTPATQPRGGSRNGSRQGSIFLDMGQSPDHSSLIFPLNLNGSPAHKPSTIRILGDEDLVPLDDLALDLDFGEDDRLRGGHLGKEFDTLEHIPLPGEEGFGTATATTKDVLVDGEGDVVMLDDELVIPQENPLPDADAFTHPEGTILETTEADTIPPAPTPSPRKRPRSTRRIDFVDDDISIPSATIKAQFQEYIALHDSLAARKHALSTARSSKRVGAAFVFERGIGAVGAAYCTMQHPLAPLFAGPLFLATLVNGRTPTAPAPAGVTQALLRTDEEVLMDIDAEDARRMPSTAGQDVDVLSVQGERSRRNTPGQEDPLGSSFAPWTQGGSAVPGSARSARSAGSKFLSPGLGSMLQDIEHLSSDIGRSGGGMYTSEEDFAVGGEVEVGGSDDRREGRAVFDSMGGFTDAMHDMVRRRQEDSRARGSVRRMCKGQREMVWIDFNDFADPTMVSRGEAARAFLNVLTLATKNMCKIQGEYLVPENEHDLGIHVIEIGFDADSMGQKEIRDIPEE